MADQILPDFLSQISSVGDQNGGITDATQENANRHNCAHRRILVRSLR